MSNPPPQIMILRMMTAFAVSQALYVMVKLGIADQLGDGQQSAVELAQAVNAHPRNLERLLKYLVSQGVLTENAGLFGLSEVGQCLRKEAPFGLADGVRLMGQAPWWQAWGSLDVAVETGAIPFDQVHGQPLFELMADQPGYRAMFQEWMTTLTRSQIGPLLAAYDFSGIRTLADIGGGRGLLLKAVLQAYPALQGLLFDLPEVLAQAEVAEVAERLSLVSGNMFESVPGADVYLIKTVLHDWPDDKVVTILRNIRQAMQPHSRLLICENLYPSGNEPHPTRFYDLHMMVILGGAERSEAQFRDLLAQADLKLERVISTAGPLSILEAVCL